MRTKQDVIINFREYGKITIPKGTRLTHETTCGIDGKYHFVNEFGWIDRDYKDVANILKHDVMYYGIDIPVEFIDK